MVQEPPNPRLPGCSRYHRSFLIPRLWEPRMRVLARMSLPTRTLALNILRAHRASSDAEVLALALKTLTSGQRYLAYELLRGAPRALGAARVADIRRFAAGMTTWSDVDCFGCFVAGVAWRTGRISRSGVYWRSSPSNWTQMLKTLRNRCASQAYRNDAGQGALMSSNAAVTHSESP